MQTKLCQERPAVPWAFVASLKLNSHPSYPPLIICVSWWSGAHFQSRLLAQLRTFHHYSPNEQKWPIVVDNQISKWSFQEQ